MSNYIDISLSAEEIEIHPGDRKSIQVDLKQVNEEDFFLFINIDKFISYVGATDIMEYLSVKDVKEFFDLKDNEE